MYYTLIVLEISQHAPIQSVLLSVSIYLHINIFSLKMQQGLLVDFGAFPQKFIDLLHLVLQEEYKEVPK